MIFQVNYIYSFIISSYLYYNIRLLDWCHVEANNCYDFKVYKHATAIELNEMLNKSPVTHVNNVITPLIICLGGKDRRVPAFQGIEYYHSLISSYKHRENKNIKNKLKLLYFPEDNHALDKVCTNLSFFIINIFIELHLYI